MAFAEKVDLHENVVNINDTLLESGNLKTKFNVFSRSKIDNEGFSWFEIEGYSYVGWVGEHPAEFIWAEAEMGLTGMEIYALKSDTRLVDSDYRDLDVDFALSRVFHEELSKVDVFFDTEGSLGRSRIYFSFFISNPNAHYILRTLLYYISTYNQRRCREVFSFYGNENTHMDLCRKLVVDFYRPLHHFYLVSCLGPYPDLIEGPRFQYIGTYDGDMQLLRGVIQNNVIINMGFVFRVDETRIRMNYQ